MSWVYCPFGSFALHFGHLQVIFPTILQPKYIKIEQIVNHFKLNINPMTDIIKNILPINDIKPIIFIFDLKLISFIEIPLI